MLARNRGRMVGLGLIASAALSLPSEALAQRFGRPTATTPPPEKPAPVAPRPDEGPTFKEVRVPASGTDPIAIVNGRAITRQRLADEAVAREGKKILETMIARELIVQALQAKGLDVTPAEVDAEIDAVAARTAGCPREDWLRNLEKEKGISPAQYARDIIYPGLALRKLCQGRVQVTDQDIKDSYEANYGPRLQCRIIMSDSIHKSSAIWEEIRKNPTRFEAIAKERSLDTTTRAAGGMLPDPIARHAYPRTVSDAAFKQLVDGDPNEKDALGKPRSVPKDGDFTGPIQVNEGAWVIMRRESLTPGRQGDLTDSTLRASLQAQMFDVKLNAAMQDMFNELMNAATIDNKLTGFTKAANEHELAGSRSVSDQDVKRMSAAGETQARTPTGGKVPPRVVTSPPGTSVTPAGVPADAASSAAAVQQAIRNTGPRTPRN